MKKILVSLLLAVAASSAFADRCCYRGGWGHGGGWIGPVLSGVIGYEIGQSQRQTVLVQQQPAYVQPVYVQPAPIIITDPNQVVINGKLYRKQLMNIDGVVQEVLVAQ